MPAPINWDSRAAPYVTPENEQEARAWAARVLGDREAGRTTPGLSPGFTHLRNAPTESQLANNYIFQNTDAQTRGADIADMLVKLGVAGMGAGSIYANLPGAASAGTIGSGSSSASSTVSSAGMQEAAPWYTAGSGGPSSLEAFGTSGIPYAAPAGTPGLASAAAAETPGIFSRAGTAIKDYVMPGGNLDLGRAASVGAGGLSMLGILTGAGTPDQPSGPPSGTPAWYDDAPMQVTPFQRSQRPMANQDYFTYGKSGGEHQFFQDANAPPVQDPSQIPTGGRMGNHMLNPDLPGSIAMGKYRGGTISRARGGQTPPTGTGGRKDDIEALLSEGEYVMDAETVALLGDGSVDAGSKRLDELRDKIRRHKGTALAKGKISPAAKRPEQYLARSKGGTIRRVLQGGMDRPNEVARVTQLEQARRVAEALAAQVKGGASAEDWGKTLGSWGMPDQGRRDTLLRREAALQRDVLSGRMRKATGGRVKGPAFKEMVALAERFENALGIGDGRGVVEASKRMDAAAPGSSSMLALHFSKGGSVAKALRDFMTGRSGIDRRATLLKDPDLPAHEAFPNRPPPELSEVHAELERLAPGSTVLRQVQHDRRMRQRRNAGQSTRYTHDEE